MKKDYQKPMLISEEFIPNEYVAACYNFKSTISLSLWRKQYKQSWKTMRYNLCRY